MSFITDLITYKGLVQPAGLPSLYMAPITNRCTLQTNTTTANKQLNALMEFWPTDDVDRIKLVYANGFQNGSGAEAGSGGVATITAGVLDADGVTIKQALTGGSATMTLADKGVGVTDWINVRLRRSWGKSVQVRTFFQGNGILWHSTAGTANDRMEFAASGLTDKSLSGTITDTLSRSTNPYCFGPVAILGMTRKGSVFLAGDSITAGVLDAPSNIYGDIGSISRGLFPDIGYINCSISGDTLALANVAANYLMRQTIKNLCPEVPVFSAIASNSVALGVTPANVAAARTTFAAKFGNARVIGATVTPRITSTSDGATTLANQTVDSTFNTAKAAFNVLQRAGIAGEAGFIDVADAFESDRDSGKIAVGRLPGATSGIALANDTIHPNTAGGERIGRAVRADLAAAFRR